MREAPAVEAERIGDFGAQLSAKVRAPPIQSGRNRLDPDCAETAGGYADPPERTGHGMAPSGRWEVHTVDPSETDRLLESLQSNRNMHNENESDGDHEEVFVVPIEEAIDLHHFHPREIAGVVDAYLDAAMEKGFVEVRLIHGRGKGVQRAGIQRRLGDDPRVERFVDAPPGRGGWGATLVWLKRPDPAGTEG